MSLVSVSSSGKVPVFWVWGDDLCVFGKFLSDTWIKRVEARKNSPSECPYFVFVFCFGCLDFFLQEESRFTVFEQYSFLSILGVIHNSGTGIAPYIPS